MEKSESWCDVSLTITAVMKQKNTVSSEKLEMAQWFTLWAHTVFNQILVSLWLDGGSGEEAVSD